VRRHPGIPAERSGSNAFWSDENLNKRATPASANDFAPGPNEDVSGILGAAAGLTPLYLPDIEVDEGGRIDDGGDYLQATPPPPPAYTPPPAPADDDRLARLENNLERLTNLLLGDK
jgi:hypothetical protein